LEPQHTLKGGKRKMDYDSSYSTGGCGRNLNFLEKEIRISANPIIGGGIKLKSRKIACDERPAGTRKEWRCSDGQFAYG
jgi:hypothetical protein